MSTITPTSDQRRTFDRTQFRIGDVVRDAAERVGTIVNPDGVFSVFVDTPPPGHVELQYVSQIPMPSGVPVNSDTSNVKVNWLDGTSTVVPVNTLRRA
jgi:hypothetical protein